MLIIGHMRAPLILLHASIDASTLSDLRSIHLGTLAKTLKHLKEDPIQLHFLSAHSSKQQRFLIDVI